MDILHYFIMALLGFIGSFFSGLMGIGGAIINYPLLLFVPQALGVAEFNAQEVASMSMFQVFFASLAGMLAFRKKGKDYALINKDLVLYMGSGILVGSLAGGFLSKYLHADLINILYGSLAIIAVVLMLIPVKGKAIDAENHLSFSKIIAVSSSFLVGIVSGIVGAGGAFILIPIMLTVLAIPTRVTIATSLAIVFISALGGILGKLTTGHIPALPTLFVILGSILGAPIGSRISSKMNVRALRYGLVVIISFTAIKVWWSILFL